MVSMKAGARTSSGRVKIELKSRPIMAPHSAHGLRMPRPRNESAATSRTAVAMPRLPATMSGVMEFGRMRLRRMPSARFAQSA